MLHTPLVKSFSYAHHLQPGGRAMNVDACHSHRGFAAGCKPQKQAGIGDIQVTAAVEVDADDAPSAMPSSTSPYVPSVEVTVAMSPLPSMLRKASKPVP